MQEQSVTTAGKVFAFVLFKIEEYDNRDQAPAYLFNTGRALESLLKEVTADEFVYPTGYIEVNYNTLIEVGSWLIYLQTMNAEYNGSIDPKIETIREGLQTITRGIEKYRGVDGSHYFKAPSYK